MLPGERGATWGPIPLGGDLVGGRRDHTYLTVKPPF